MNIITFHDYFDVAVLMFGNINRINSIRIIKNGAPCNRRKIPIYES